ncbi:glycosyltransferase [Kribbella sp. NBC_01245]|uniref:glycosyltransferase family 2 protein n=1 Tax=Kribbella sp. NBC_01245 TaxID=2903578 RepID=UPI002E2E1852|nr:glycosyltransferase [Kribbella sp. NBC_01245]
MAHWPSVTAVVPTHQRPQMLRAAIRSILGQDYPGRLDVLVVHDKEAIDDELGAEFGDRVKAIANTRTPGLCGARNTGILASAGELIAFCDDDDSWLPSKLTRQVERLRLAPESVLASTAMTVNFLGVASDRLAGRDTISHQDLLVSRMAMLHSSSFLVRREWMVGGQLLNEDLPGSMGEDWDILLRASRQAPVAHVDEPLVRIHWGSTSFFARDWRTRLTANTWFLKSYPELRESRRGTARLQGQNAFFAAANGDRRAALTWIARTVRSRAVEPRAWLAVPVLVAPRLGNSVMGALHRRGRGI